MNGPARGPGPSPRAVRAVFVLTGLYFGWRWTSGGHGPPWQHALRVLATMLTALALVQSVRWWRTRRGRRGGAMDRFPWRDLILLKLLLVALALAAEYVLHRWMPPTHARVVVGVCLGAAIAVGGPIVHRRHTGPSPAEAPAVEAPTPPRPPQRPETARRTARPAPGKENRTMKFRRRHTLVTAAVAVAVLGGVGTDLGVEHVADQRMAGAISCRLKPAGPVRARLSDPLAGLQALTGTLGTAQIDADDIHRAGTDLDLRVVLHDVTAKGGYSTGTATATIPYSSLQQRLGKGAKDSKDGKGSKDNGLTLGTDGSGLTLTTTAGQLGFPVTVNTALAVTSHSFTITPTTITLMGRRLPVSELAQLLPNASSALTDRLAPHTIDIAHLPAGAELTAAHADPSGLSLVLTLRHRAPAHAPAQHCPST